MIDVVVYYDVNAGLLLSVLLMLAIYLFFAIAIVILRLLFEIDLE